MQKTPLSNRNSSPSNIVAYNPGVNSWKEKHLLYAAASYSFNNKLPKRTKTYNQPVACQSKPQSNTSYYNNTSPLLSLSSSIKCSSDPSSTSSLPQQIPSIKKHQKRHLSSENILKIMDKRLLQKQYQQQLNELLAVSHVDRSASLSRRLGLHQQRLSDALSKPTTTRQAQKIPIKEPTIRYQERDSLITEYPYVLVQDNDEQDRMVTQHYLLRTLFSSDFCSPIRSQLQKGIVVLDVGCGPGTWTMEMSTAFPKSTFIGIDQSTFFPKDIKPRNCHFRTCYPLVQEQLPLPFPDNSIDYIYQRDMNWGLMAQTWQPLIQEYLRILKPGGWIEFMEPDLETQNSPKSDCDLNDKLITGLCLRQQDPYVVHRLPTMLSINGFKKIETIFQPCRLGWEVSQDANLSNAIGLTAVTEKQEKAPNYSEFSRAMSSQYMLLLKSLRPWLSIVMNLSHEKYDDYIAEFPAEWSQARTYINWHCIIAQKPHYI